MIGPENPVELLRSCPFCAWSRVKVNELRRGNNRREGDNYQAICTRCKARGPLVKDSEKLAAELWNKRTRMFDGPIIDAEIVTPPIEEPARLCFPHDGLGREVAE